MRRDDIKIESRHKVSVFDTGNRKRLLGYVYADKIGPVPGELEVGRHWEFCAVQYPHREPWYMAKPEATVDVIRVSFRVAESPEVVHGSHGWVKTLCLVTSAELSDLLKIETFHLPGETDREHAMRHNSYRWP